MTETTICDISKLPPDSMLRELIRAAQREWDMQANMPSDEIERLRKVVFHGSEVGFDAYMTQRLIHHLSNILIVAERTNFMSVTDA